ncbi:MAG: AAC(3) family N-acetyltransferase [Bacteroidales bacterium]
MIKLLIRKLSVYSTVIYFYIRRHIKKLPRLRKKTAYSKKAGVSFEKYIRGIPANRIFVHVSLSAVRHFTGRADTYTYLRDLLLGNFDVLVSQAFTPGVRKTRVFNPEKEIPAYGAFARQFFTDRHFRNHDPCYSIIAAGENHFEAGDLTFAPDGIFRQMIDHDYHCLNIGLDYVTCSLMHFVEYEQRVPYLNFYREKYTIKEGLLKKPLLYPIHSNRRAYSVKGYVWWNKIRLMKDLKKTNIVNQRNIDGVVLYDFSMRKLYDFVTEKVKNDPYYLIKW